MSIYYTGFADEAGSTMDAQIKATKELGWKHIEARALYGGNLASISEKDFEDLCGKLADAKVSINCYGSGIANWAKPITEPPDSSYDEMRKAIPRMQKLGIKLVRVMSFAVPKELIPNSMEYYPEVVKRLKVIAKMAEDAGVTCVHENCMNWGGLSHEHTLRILDGVKSPNFKLVFDTGNPVFNDDVRGAPPYRKQRSLEFFRAVKDHVAYIHIKDGRMVDGKGVFTFPGEGDASVKEILGELIRGGYSGGISIEPHMVTVFHDKDQKPKEQLMYENYVEYGRRLMKIVEAIGKQKR